MSTKRETAKEHTISAILEAAIAEFAEKGYDGATVRSIAAGAGVANGLVCTYFGSKEKLLCAMIDQCRPDIIFEDLSEADPYSSLCTYLDHIKDMQRKDPLRFRLHRSIAGGSGFPDSVKSVIRAGFEGSKMEAAIRTAQEHGQIVNGDPLKVFKMLSGSAYVLLDQYAEMGAEAPDNDTLLQVIGYKPEKKTNSETAAGDRKYVPDVFPEKFTINEETLPLISRMCELIPGGFFIYHADGNKDLIAFNSFMISMYGCANAEEFKALTGNSFKGLVHPEDYAESEESIAAQIEGSDRKIDHVKYRFIRKDGSIGMLDDYGHFSRSDSFGDIFYVFVQDITRENREEQRVKQLEALNSILNDYDGVFLIDCANDTRRTFHDRLSGAARYDDAVNYSALFAQYVENCVCAPDSEMMRGFIDPANILKILGDRKEMTVTYRDRTTGTQRFYEMKIIRFSDTEILQSFRENDAEMVNSLLFDKLKDNYFALFGVDLETGLMRSYKDDPMHVLGKEGEVSTLSSVMQNLASFFEGETKSFFERCGDVNWLRERFIKEDRAEYVCRSAQEDRKGWVNVTGIVFSRNEDGMPSLFCLAFNYLDERSAQVHEMQLQLQEEYQRNELFFETFNAGKWAYEISAEDEVVAAYYSDAVHRSTNIPTYSGRAMGWLDVVHPDDRERVRAAFMAPVYDHSGETKYDVNFRVIGKDGGIRWTKSVGKVIRRPDGTGEFFGMNVDITGEVKEQEQYLAKRVEADQFINSFIKDYGVVFKVNREDDTFRILKDNGAMRTKELLFDRFTQGTEYMLEHIVYAADRDKVRRAIDRKTVERRLAENPAYSVDYRVLINGVTRWDRMTFTVLDGNYAAVGFAIRGRETILDRLQEKEYGNYYALFAIDMDAEQITMLKNDSGYATGTVGSTVPYREAMTAFANSLEGEAKDFFLKFSDIEQVKGIHAVEDKLTYVYRSSFDGERSWVRATSYAVIRHEDGSPAVATLGFNFMDSMGADRQEMERKLRTAYEEAQAANRAKSAFLFNMSHDIRTPMNAIIGFTNIAKKHIDDREKVQDCLEKTQKSGNMLLSLINSVLEVSRIESGRAALEEQHGDIYYSFANIESTMREIAESKDIDLSFEFGNIRDRYVHADFARCMRVFLNVLSNAIKYTPDGGTVKVLCEQVGKAKDGYGYYKYVVSDNGIGMSEEYLPQIYEQFSRENSSTVSGIQGSGLGMSVVKSFVDLMNGTIDVQSKKGEGTTVTIVLPFRLQKGAQYTDPDTGDVVTSGEDSSAKSIRFRGRKVLLVEDNMLNRELAEEILEDEGFTVEVAEDGTDAVEMLREKGPDCYDFILMDIQMPKMNGYEATKAIRAMYPDARIPIIAVSANAFEEDKKASREAGMNGHVAKPINVKELFGTLAEFLY